jgi:hypothetical protein
MNHSSVKPHTSTHRHDDVLVVGYDTVKSVEPLEEDLSMT